MICAPGIDLVNIGSCWKANLRHVGERGLGGLITKLRFAITQDDTDLRLISRLVFISNFSCRTVECRLADIGRKPLLILSVPGIQTWHSAVLRPSQR